MNALIPFVIAIYLRLSSEDDDLKQLGKLESNSIANQRNLLRDFISCNEEWAAADVVEFCDDGWSGKNFERPGVQEMIAQARQGHIQCIIVKDLSRFGRDHLIVDNYISRVFPFLGVRFIAVNDGIDSIRPEDVDSMETSFKTRSLGPFGYVKDPAKSSRLMIDPPAAEIVRYIFQMAIDGKRRVEIARTLNQEAVLTPMLYKRAAGCSRTIWPCVHEDNFWTTRAVTKILRDERYIGTNVYGKRTRDMVGHVHTVKVNRANWITVEQTHDGIVTREEFERAQAAMRDFEEYDGHMRKPLRRKVFCGICGHAMARSYGTNAFYACHTARVGFGSPCTEEPVPEADIRDVVLFGLRTQAAMAVEMERLWVELHQNKAGNPANMRKKLSALYEQQAQQDQKLKELYERFILGETSKAEYLAGKETIVKSREATSSQIEKLKACLEDTNAEGRLQNRFVSCFRQYKDIEALTKEIADDVLEKIIVYPGGRIQVVWNYQDDLEKMMLDLNIGEYSNGQKTGMDLLQDSVS